MVFWPGPHGGLTVVHGGGNTALRIEFEMDSGTPANSVTRLDGLSWIDAGFSLGQRVQVEGDGKTRTIIGFVNPTCPFADPFPNCGLDSTMISPDDVDQRHRSTRRTGVSTAIHVADAEKVSDDRADERHGAAGVPARACRPSTLTCATANELLRVTGAERHGLQGRA